MFTVWFLTISAFFFSAGLFEDIPFISFINFTIITLYSFISFEYLFSKSFILPIIFSFYWNWICIYSSLILNISLWTKDSSFKFKNLSIINSFYSNISSKIEKLPSLILGSSFSFCKRMLQRTFKLSKFELDLRISVKLFKIIKGRNLTICLPKVWISLSSNVNLYKTDLKRELSLWVVFSYTDFSNFWSLTS